MNGYREQNSPVPQPELPLKGIAEQQKKVVNKPVAELEQTGDQSSQPLTGVRALNKTVAHFMTDAPTCDNCGAITVRNGACYKCLNCGNSMGCS